MTLTGALTSVGIASNARNTGKDGGSYWCSVSGQTGVIGTKATSTAIIYTGGTVFGDNTAGGLTTTNLVTTGSWQVPSTACYRVRCTFNISGLGGSITSITLGLWGGATPALIAGYVYTAGQSTVNTGGSVTAEYIASLTATTNYYFYYTIPTWSGGSGTYTANMTVERLM